jgi:putative nucleotidyltransferase with HDIG domain
VAATRGVLQSPGHHLDVFDHTLLVLANLEAIVHADDPLAALFDPGRLDRQADRALREQGVCLPPIPGGPHPEPPADPAADAALWAYARALVGRWLDEKTRLVLKWAALFHDVGKPATRALNEDARKGRRVQFLGHPVYGLQIVTGHLDLYFPDPDQRARVSDLILRHHDHHLWVKRYWSEKPAARAPLEQAKDVAGVSWDELKYLTDFWEPDVNPHAGDFLALLFHGYADALAGRGPEEPVPVAETAAIDRAMLRFYAMYVRARDEHAERFDEFFDGLSVSGLTPGLALRGRLRPWFLRDTYTRTAGGKPAITADEFLRKAKQMNG